MNDLLQLPNESGADYEARKFRDESRARWAQQPTLRCHAGGAQAMNALTIIMLANIVIECGWIAAMVFLVMSDHPWWAAASLLAAVFSGYTWKSQQ